MEKIANFHEYTIRKRDNEEYPFEIYIDGYSTGHCSRTIEAAQKQIQVAKKEYQRDNSIELNFANQLGEDLEDAIPRYYFYGTIHTADDGFKEEGCEIEIHYPDIDEEDGHDYGNTIWVTDCHSIALRYLTNFGFNAEEAKTFARIVSLYVGKTSLTYKSKELYSFEKGEEI